MKEIKETRQKLKLTQAELAEKLGTSANIIALWERGAVTPQHPKMLQLALRALENEISAPVREKIRKFETDFRRMTQENEATLKRLNV